MKKKKQKTDWVKCAIGVLCCWQCLQVDRRVKIDANTDPRRCAVGVEERKRRGHTEERSQRLQRRETNWLGGRLTDTAPFPFPFHQVCLPAMGVILALILPPPQQQ